MVLNIIHSSPSPYATYLNTWRTNTGGRNRTIKIRKCWSGDAVIDLNKIQQSDKSYKTTVRITFNSALVMSHEEFVTFVQAMNEAFNLLDKE